MIQKTFTIQVVEKIERLRILEIHANNRDEAEDKALLMQNRWNDVPPAEIHEESYIDSIKEVG